MHQLKTMIGVTKECVQTKVKYIADYLGKTVAPVSMSQKLLSIPESQNKLIQERIEHFRDLEGMSEQKRKYLYRHQFV